MTLGNWIGVAIGISICSLVLSVFSLKLNILLGDVVKELVRPTVETKEME